MGTLPELAEACDELERLTNRNPPGMADWLKLLNASADTA
jgi:hypothetical protein